MSDNPQIVRYSLERWLLHVFLFHPIAVQPWLTYESPKVGYSGIPWGFCRRTLSSVMGVLVYVSVTQAVSALLRGLLRSRAVGCAVCHVDTWGQSALHAGCASSHPSRVWSSSPHPGPHWVLLKNKNKPPTYHMYFSFSNHKQCILSMKCTQ